MSVSRVKSAASRAVADQVIDQTEAKSIIDAAGGWELERKLEVAAHCGRGNG